MSMMCTASGHWYQFVSYPRRIYAIGRRAAGRTSSSKDLDVILNSIYAVEYFKRKPIHSVMAMELLVRCSTHSAIRERALACHDNGPVLEL